jgi:dephospho-CoA kinase
MTEAAARGPIAAQVPRSQRLAAADVAIDNSGSLAALETAEWDLWRVLLRREGSPRAS